jgi:hypothetical protein
MFKKFVAEWKAHPHNPNQASFFGFEQLRSVKELESTDECLDHDIYITDLKKKKNVGVNEIKAASQRVKLRLPEDEQVTKLLTGRSSRKAYVSNRLQAAVDPSILALSTGHQDSRSVQKYLINSNASLASGSLQQAKWLRHDDEEQFACVNMGTQLIEKSLFQTTTAPDGSS